MYALLDFVPSHCPHCGAAFEWGRRNPRRDPAHDYHAHVSYECEARCGFQYLYVETALILETAAALGSTLTRGPGSGHGHTTRQDR
jgi:hypothetical protein